MSIYELIFLSIALALDAMVVSFSYGLVIYQKRLENSLKLALAFGFFQFLMPIIGWIMANVVYNYSQLYADYIVFAIFILLAIKFIKEALNKQETVKNECISLFCLLTLAVATSIDAFGAGISIRFLNAKIIFSAIIIGLITFFLSLIGFRLASMFRKINSKALKILAGCIFIYLAISAVL